MSILPRTLTSALSTQNHPSIFFYFASFQFLAHLLPRIFSHDFAFPHANASVFFHARTRMHSRVCLFPHPCTSVLSYLLTHLHPAYLQACCLPIPTGGGEAEPPALRLAHPLSCLHICIIPRAYTSVSPHIHSHMYPYIPYMYVSSF